MATPFDAAARLAEGQPAVDDVTAYVLACSRLGFQHADLTSHAAQVRDWYGSEDGLDLRALDADRAAITAAATAAEDAARSQAALAAELSKVWSGRGAASAGEFTSRTGRAATAVAAAVRTAAAALTSLRDDLWQAVDTKVATVQSIDARHQAERAEWLAAARTVTTGGGDVATASELVDQQVKPFVANDIATEWIAAMRTAAASVDAAYDTAIARTAVDPAAVFDVPGSLGPQVEAWARPQSDGGGEPMAATYRAAVAAAPVDPMGAATAGSTWSEPVSMPPASPAPAPAPSAMSAAEPVAGAPLTTPASVPPAPSMGELGGMTPALGSGGSGFGQQLADLIGGLVGSLGGTGELGGVDDALVESADEPDIPGEDTDESDDTEETGHDGTETDETADEQTADEETTEPTGEVIEDSDGDPAEQPADSPPSEPISPPPPPPPPPAESLEAPDGADVTAGRTPCEIAADQLPQVGE